MAIVLRVNFGDIMQAIEDKLVLDNVAVPAQITWASESADVPQFSGEFDILFIARRASHAPYDGGAWDLRLHRMLDIFVRSQSIGDAGGGAKEFVKRSFVLGDKVLDSVGADGFWPVDEDENELTVECIKFVGDVAPAQHPSGAYGDYVGTLSIVYYPKVTPTRT